MPHLLLVKAFMACFAWALLAWSGPGGGFFAFELFRQENPGRHYVEVILEAEGATSARIQRGGDGWIDLEADGDEFEVVIPDPIHGYSTLADLNAAVAGDWTLEITHGGRATTTYTFAVRAAVEADFPPLPVLDPVPATLPNVYEFAWQWAGTADFKSFEAMLYGVHDYDNTDWGSGHPDFPNLSHTMDFEGKTGNGDAMILYGNQLHDLVTDWTLADGMDLLPHPPWQAAVSEDYVLIQVGGEPGGDPGDGFFAFELFRQESPGRHYVEVILEAEGATSARIQREGDGWIDLEQDGDEFEVVIPDPIHGYGTLAELNAAVAGDWTLEITHGGRATTTYTFAVRAAVAADFPPLPAFDPVPATLPNVYEFAWQWAGTADFKSFETMLYGVHDYDNTDWGSGHPDFPNLIHTMDFEGKTGNGDAMILYGNQLHDLVTDWTLADGMDLLPHPPWQGAVSEDYVLIQVGGEPGGGSFTFAVGRQENPDRYYAELFFEAAGVTSARARRGADGWLALEEDGDEFVLDIPDGDDGYGTLAELNAAVAGNWTLEITHGGRATTIYTFAVRPAVAGDFPPLPVLDPVPATLPNVYEFSWQWSGAADGRFFEAELFDVHEYENVNWPANHPDFADRSHTMDFEGLTGDGEVLVAYQKHPHDLVTGWTLTEGDDLLPGGLWQSAISEDTALVQVDGAGPGPGGGIAAASVGRGITTAWPNDASFHEASPVLACGEGDSSKLFKGFIFFDIAARVDQIGAAAEVSLTTSLVHTSFEETPFAVDLEYIGTFPDTTIGPGVWEAPALFTLPGVLDENTPHGQLVWDVSDLSAQPLGERYAVFRLAPQGYAHDWRDRFYTLADDPGETFLTVHPGAAGFFAFELFRQENPGRHYVEVILDAAGTTSARIQREGNDWLYLEADGDKFELVIPDPVHGYGTLTELNTAVVGNWTLEITHGGRATTTYTFAVRTAVEADFPPLPVLDPVPATLPNVYEFAWQWVGTADFKSFETMLYGVHDYDNTDWGSGHPDFPNLSHTMDFEGKTGNGDAMILYGNQLHDLVTGWTLADGMDLLPHPPWQGAVSEDYVLIQVGGGPVSPVPWQMAIAVTGAFPDTLEFGMAEGATESWDEGLDAAATPPGPGEEGAYLHHLGQDYARDLRGVTAAGTVTEWLLVAQAGVADELTLDWSLPPGFPVDALLTMYEIAAPTERGDPWLPVGDTAIDMARTQSAVVPPGEIRTWKIRFGPDLIADLRLEKGWNLKSLPIQPHDPAVASIFAAHPARGGTIHAGTVWGWQGGEYAERDTLDALEPVWVYLEQPAVLVVHGLPVELTHFHLAPGLNLVGVPESLPVPAAEELRGPCWRWQAQSLRYLPAATLEPYAGYWLDSAAETVIPAR